MIAAAAGSDINPCFPYRRALRSCRVRLFCFPWAGAGASAFRDWDNLLPPEIELCAFQAPGRETRFREPQAQVLETLVEHFLAETVALRDRPFMLLGHSFGAMVAAEAALRLADADNPPEALVVMGCPAPNCSPRHAPIAHLNRAAFLRALADFGGLDDDALADPELADLLLPGLRADCRMAEGWRVDAVGRFRRPLPCVIAAVAGRDDPYAAPTELEAWREFGNEKSRIINVPGNHFFLRSTPLPVIKLLCDLARHLACDRSAANDAA